MKTATIALLISLGSALFFNVSSATAGDTLLAAKRDWAATGEQRACTAKCQRQNDNLAYEKCLVECNESSKANRGRKTKE